MLWNRNAAHGASEALRCGPAFPDACRDVSGLLSGSFPIAFRDNAKALYPLPRRESKQLPSRHEAIGEYRQFGRLPAVADSGKTAAADRLAMTRPALAARSFRAFGPAAPSAFPAGHATRVVLR